ncbi:hypothetical protein niasHT_038699 [Heterodera trifolii]|uniref:C2H2-type domain-containing protein n=1 Tax=Heterodera trifolii TaxID=157864 RepID=A0ABD2HZH1_9BILA
MPIILNQGILSTTCDEQQRETLKLQLEPAAEYNETNFKRTVLNASGTPINGAFTFWSAPSTAAPAATTSVSNLSATTTVISSEPDLTPLTPSTSDVTVNGHNSNVKVLKPVPLVIRTQSADEIAGAVAHPTKPSEIRKLIRSKMLRCRICRNRFLDKHIYERHLRDRHPKEHAAYVSQQEDEVRQQRKEEFEANRLDELVSGGFIPPQEDLDASKYEVNIKEIPLPGELTGGVPARFDRFGVLFQPKRLYKKKVSPQCPFCDKRYRNEYSLKKHIAKKHTECAEWVQCLKCFKAVPSKAEMVDHLCEMIYLCFECVPPRNLCNDVRLYNHRTKFHRGHNSGFKCNLCNQKFLTPRKLRKHKKMSHVFTKTYQCHFCEELFISETAVTTHERIHTGIIKFECKICDYKCNRFLNMEDHVKEDHGYLCPICQSKLSEWGDLKNHMLMDHGGYLSSEFNSGYIESPRVWLMFKGD